MNNALNFPKRWVALDECFSGRDASAGLKTERHRSVSSKRRVRASLALAVLAGACVGTGTAAPNIRPCSADEVVDVTPADSVEQPNVDSQTAETLRFSFNGVPWREVIQWLADEADLALHISELPSGSFTYTDNSEFTVQEAIDRVNLFLISEGFTLVRSGRLLSVIDLTDPRGVQQLETLAEFVDAEQLADRKPHDVVKCIFSLGEIDGEDAVQELSALNLMTSPTVLNKTNQLIVTDSVAKLRSVQRVLSAFKLDEMDNGTIVQSFQLRHVTADDVLTVARPHLGLATDEMIGIDVSLSADLGGNSIFVTGIEDKVKLLEGLVKAVDQPDSAKVSSNEPMQLRSYLVPGGNVRTVYNVLQTLLSGKTVRLSMDDDAGTIVALASAETQAEISQTVDELQAADDEFEVIQLKSVDPSYAISLIDQMLDLPDEYADPDDIDPDTPRIDADPGNRRLFVRGKRHRIDQIKTIVEGLEKGGAPSDAEQIRVLPFKGKNAQRLLETGAKFWQSTNPVILYPGHESDSPNVLERVPNEDESDASESSDPGPDHKALELTSKRSLTDEPTEARLLTTVTRSRSQPITCQITSRGLILQSEDTTALNEFEQHLRSLGTSMQPASSPPIAFYLQHIRPDDALRMLAELLEGGEAAKEGEAGTLINGTMTSVSSGGYLGSFLTTRDGTMTLLFGSITIVSDSRLNRLIAQGSSDDIDLIENYLKIIDKDRSITTVQTYGTSRVIELKHTRAEDVAEAVQAAYAGRMAEGNGKANAAAGGGNDSDARDAARNGDNRGNSKNPPKKSASQAARDLEPKMTVAVHEASNSLIVTAPQQLFAEVETLVQTIDSRGEQAVEVIIPSSDEVMGEVLQQVLGASTITSRRPTTSSSRDRSRDRGGR
ncbi:secretin N-terminal domain-containing protein [Rhodopirellula europaea]|jgi:type II secretory pathway component GspD/PulD (secretin)|uniref:NolW domain protein n=1 Tax=Rhodopirellula europaea SH398 TaxID=1263868 RepID=M5S431_9BACT|nr:secretin N-terminal domain-containing protein [Rhodopirellula europaea]EMI26275.1 NolW domain protein [Rhodopirellula europaea SH398]